MPGLNDSKSIESHAITRAAFFSNDAHSTSATGLHRSAVPRAVLVSSECLYEHQDVKISEQLRQHSVLKVVKHSGDSSPFWCRAADGSKTRTDVYNHRLFLRWSEAAPDCSRVILPGAEHIGSTALSLLEAIARTCPQLSPEELQQFAEATDWSPFGTDFVAGWSFSSNPWGPPSPSPPPVC